MIWTKLATFLLTLLGIGLNWIYQTWKMDQADTEHDLSLRDVIWVGPARWKTILNVAFLAAVSFFFPQEYLEAAVASVGGGAELGWGLPIVFGILSEGIMVAIFKRAITKNAAAE